MFRAKSYLKFVAKLPRNQVFTRACEIHLYLHYFFINVLLTMFAIYFVIFICGLWFDLEGVMGKGSPYMYPIFSACLLIAVAVGLFSAIRARQKLILERKKIED